MTQPLDPIATLNARLAPRRSGLLDIVSPLRHFALITYAVPVERLLPHIPGDRFEIPTFDIDGKALALLSVVPFIDAGFHFRAFPLLRFHFAQTNYRVYVIEKGSGEHAVWFFGTTLGGWPVHAARFLWKIPWYPARYSWGCEFNETTEGTEIVLTHEPFVTPDFLSLHQIGWTSGLEHLAALVRT